MTKAIFIDADNTLLDFDRCSLFAMKNAFGDIGVEFEEEFFDIFHTVNNGLWERFERGEIGKDGIFGVRWKNIFEMIGVDHDPFDFENRFRSYIDISAEKVEGASEIMEYLSSKYRVFIVSNAAEKQQRFRIEKSGLKKFVTEIFTSERIGFQKPDRAFFEKCLNEANVTADETFVIGDSLTADIQGGKSVGCKTIWFDFHKKGSNKNIKADFEVQKLAEIKKIL